MGQNHPTHRINQHEGAMESIEPPIKAQSSPKFIMPTLFKSSSEGFVVLEKRWMIRGFTPKKR
jgi:hypothetical protein